MKLVQRMLRLTVCVLAVSLTIGGAAYGQQPVASDTAGVIGKGSAPDTSRKNLQAVQATTLPASISVTFLVAALLGAVGGLASTLNLPFHSPASGMEVPSPSLIRRVSGLDMNPPSGLVLKTRTATRFFPGFKIPSFKKYTRGFSTQALAPTHWPLT